LPDAARRALKEYRYAESQRLLADVQIRIRKAAVELLVSKKVTGKHADALRLYVGLDDGKWHTYREIVAMLCVSREWVRKLLLPSKLGLAVLLEREQSTLPGTKAVKDQLSEDPNQWAKSSCRLDKVTVDNDQTLVWTSFAGSQAF